MCSDITILIELWSNQDQKSTLVAIELKTRATLRVAADTALLIVIEKNNKIIY